MTGNLLIDSAISLAGIAVLVVLTRLIFSAPPAPVSEAGARERLAFDEPDFEPQFWIIDMGGRAALALATTGEAAIIRRLGRDLITRRFRATKATIVLDGSPAAAADIDHLVIKLPDHTVKDIKIAVGSDMTEQVAALQRALV